MYKQFWKTVKDRFHTIKYRGMLTICNQYAVVLHALACFFGYFIIESLCRHSVAEAWTFLFERSWVFLFNTLLIFLTTLPVFLLRRRIFWRCFIALFWLMLGIINCVVLYNRVTPFTGPDLKMLDDMVGVIGTYMTPFQMVLSIAGLACALALLIFLMIKAPKYQGKRHLIRNLILILCSVLAFMGLTRWELDRRLLSTYFGNVAFAYEDYGYPYCLGITIFNTGISSPNGYSEELVESIVKSEGPIEETQLSQTPNIITIQLESFFDPTRVKWLHFSEDPIPNFHALQKKYSSGLYMVPSVGAGTANTEFETGTGMSLQFFGAGEYPYKSILKSTTCESAAYVLKNLGYATHAIHNNEANFYSRKLVFSHLGFDTFTSEEYMDTQDDINQNGWMRDRDLIGPINDALDESDAPDYIFTVSVQGHGAYPEEPMTEKPVIDVSGASTDEESCQWEYYVNQIHEMDQFVQDLTDELSKREEPTIVLFYGDHLPTIGLEDADLSSGNLFQTDYVIWDNFGLEEVNKNTAAFQMMSEIFDRLNIHDGVMFRYHQTKQNSPRYEIDMQTLQYDMLYGERYVFDQKHPYQVSLMKLGVKPVTVSHVNKLSEKTYYVYGSNFTQSCRVEVHDELLDTVYLDHSTLLVRDVQITEGALVDVVTQSNSSTAKVLSRSNVITFHAE